jgi:hypothetical protein
MQRCLSGGAKLTELPAIPVKSKLSRKVWKRQRRRQRPMAETRIGGSGYLYGSSRRRAKSPRRSPNGQLSARQAAAGS